MNAIRPEKSLTLVVLGLSLSSAWGNGHATTYRALLRGFAARGHRVIFLERDVPWYAENRDLPSPDFCTLHLYESPGDLRSRFHDLVRNADCVIVGSYVPDGWNVGDWAQATATGPVMFYDIDTPVTLAALTAGDCAYLTPELVSGYDLYLSFTGGPTLQRLVNEFGAPQAAPLYCAVDLTRHSPVDAPLRWDLNYLGTYSTDRQPKVDGLLLDVAGHRPGRRFAVAGPQYPETIAWPGNVQRIEHLAPEAHNAFYCGSRFTLNVTRAAMVDAGWSPSVRLFEAAACGVPVISDAWDGLKDLFEPGREIFVVTETAEVLDLLDNLGEGERKAVGAAARRRVLAAHSGERRAAELEGHCLDLLGIGSPSTLMAAL